jgi:hypothetical protein
LCGARRLEVPLSAIIDVASRYLELAIQNFERAEREDSAELRASYRDKALEMLDRRMQPSRPH